MKWLSKVEVSPEVALRAVAISAVTFNHSQKLGFHPGFGGGMSFLMMLSGYNFAKFAMTGRSAEAVRRALLNLAAAVAFPTMLVVLGSSLIKGRFEWSELLLVSNWTNPDDVALMYLWYPEVLVQMLLGLWALFSVPRLADLILGHPFWSAFSIFAAAVVVRLAFPVEALFNQLPHLLLWNFALGWVVYFTLESPVIPGDRRKRLFALSCAVLGGFVGWEYDKANPYVLTALTALFLFVRSFPAPAFAARLVNLVSQATFGIFLLHFAFITLYDHWFAQDTIAKFLFATVLSVASWLAVASMMRAYAVLSRGGAAQAGGYRPAASLAA